MRSVLIYDADCAYCSASASAAERLSAVAPVPWEHPAAQSFLEAQFGEAPFAMFLVDPPRGVVYGGRSAARELADRAGMPALASDILSAEYDTIASAVGVLLRRDRETDDYHGVYDIDERASEKTDELFGAGSGN